MDVEDIAESDAKGLSSPLAPSALHVLQNLDSLLALQKPDEASTKVIKTCESSVLGMHSNFMQVLMLSLQSNCYACIFWHPVVRLECSSWHQTKSGRYN